MRGATYFLSVVALLLEHFNPRSSCEERHISWERDLDYYDISIHAPHARSDAAGKAASPGKVYFNPRSSCEERLRQHLCGQENHISIHAPHARSDCHISLPSKIRQKISIHAPHARSDVTMLMTAPVDWLFQSTLLMRGATHDFKFLDAVLLISIHAPHARSDPKAPPAAIASFYFNPRSSCEERRWPISWYLPYRSISIHAPHARSDSTPVGGST